MTDYLIDSDRPMGLITFDRDRTYCAGCEAHVWVEFTTHEGRLVQLPLECGHKYDADAKPPEPEPPPVTGPARPCHGCDATLQGGSTKWCPDCRVIRRAEALRTYKERRKLREGRA